MRASQVSMYYRICRHTAKPALQSVIFFSIRGCSFCTERQSISIYLKKLFIIQCCPGYPYQATDFFTPTRWNQTGNISEVPGLVAPAVLLILPGPSLLFRVMSMQ